MHVVLSMARAPGDKSTVSRRGVLVLRLGVVLRAGRCSCSRRRRSTSSGRSANGHKGVAGNRSSLWTRARLPLALDLESMVLGCSGGWEGGGLEARWRCCWMS